MAVLRNVKNDSYYVKDIDFGQEKRYDLKYDVDSN